MKIAFFNYLPLEYGGGMAKYFIDVSTGLIKRYHNLDISIITFDQKLAQKINFLYSLFYLNKVHYDSFNSLNNKLGQVNYIQCRSMTEIKRAFENYDLLYAKNDIVESYILKYVVGHQNLPPVIFGFHTPVYYEVIYSVQAKLHNLIYNSFFYASLIRDASAFHALNAFDDSLLKKRFPDKNTVKIYNPFDFKEFEKKATYASFWQASGTSASRISKKLIDSGQARVTRLIWVGRLTLEKGIVDLLKLIGKINIKYKKKIIWSIVGSGPWEKRIINFVENWNNVKLLGQIKYSDMPTYYKRSDIFIMTSKLECLPYVLFEAQSFGLPIIAYDIHGVRDIIENGRNGILVETVKQFEESIVDFINNKKVFNRKKIKKYIRKKFDSEQNYSALYNLFLKTYEKSLQ